MKTIAFFNNKGGVGKTSLVYHVAWMLSDLGVHVVVVDLDPQANLTGLFIDESRLAEMWSGNDRPTVYSALRPLFDREGPQQDPRPEIIGERIALLIGDLALSLLEDKLGAAWGGTMSGESGDFRLMSSFSRLISAACALRGAQIALVDVGPNLGALNRAALLACDRIVVPVGADFFSLQGLRNMGPTLLRWRSEWGQRLRAVPENFSPSPPPGSMKPIGYVVARHSVRLGKPVNAFANWLDRFPEEYARSVLGVITRAEHDDRDNHCLATLSDYQSLMPMAHEAQRPVFHLRSADGAFGGHQRLVSRAREEFQKLTIAILNRAGSGDLLP